MVMYVLTMNMPSHSGKSVHNVVCGHAAEDIAELAEVLAREDFIVVEEFYSETAHDGSKHYVSNGLVALNPMFVGKVKVFRDSY